jgi:hypothetical protein
MHRYTPDSTSLSYYILRAIVGVSIENIVQKFVLKRIVKNSSNTSCQVLKEYLGKDLQQQIHMLYRM